jgi:hypothetical protein
MAPRILRWILAALVLLALAFGTEAGQTQAAASLFKGEYFVTENKHPVCVPYTRNLNQFRRLHFDVCDPRLSEKFPQFTRPAWKEIQLDLALAEQIIKNTYSRPENAVYWDEWLKVSESLRSAGKIKLWRTQIDIDNDGVPETLLRLEHPLTPKKERDGKGWSVDQSACLYRNSMLYMLASPNTSMREGFNQTAYAITDILHFSGGLVSPGSYNAYYGVDWRLGLPSWAIGKRIGATRGLTVYALFNMGAGDCCRIDWVPTGQYRPLKRAPR